MSRIEGRCFARNSHRTLNCVSTSRTSDDIIDKAISKNILTCYFVLLFLAMFPFYSLYIHILHNIILGPESDLFSSTALKIIGYGHHSNHIQFSKLNMFNDIISREGFFSKLNCHTKNASMSMCSTSKHWKLDELNSIPSCVTRFRMAWVVIETSFSLLPSNLTLDFTISNSLLSLCRTNWLFVFSKLCFIENSSSYEIVNVKSLKIFINKSNTINLDKFCTL